jgi:soluble lytic murein transglycosylase-like protein
MHAPLHDPARIRRPLALAVLALCAFAAPAGATTRGDTIPLPLPEAPHLTPTPAPGYEFWKRVREEVVRFAASPVPDFRYARRSGASPEIARAIDEVARAEGVDPELAFRIIRVESGFDPRARGRGGALGLMQLMPSTARSLDRSADTAEEVLNPRTNLRLGLRYLRSLLDMFDGDVRLAVLAYNRGEVTVARLLRAGRDPENGYSRRVLGTRTATPYRGTGIIERTAATPRAR